MISFQVFARDLAADRDAAVAVLHRAIPDDDIFNRDADAPPVIVTAGFQSDAIIAGIERAIFDQDITARLRIASIIVRTVAVDRDSTDNNVGAKDRVNLPHWRIP